MENKTETERFGSDYWDRIAEQPGVKNREDVWRAHQREVYRRLKDRWGGEGRLGRTLKTDLYDEAVSPHDLISLFGSESDCVVGTDVYLVIARAARQRMARAGAVRCQVVVSDVRHQAFKSHVFDQILSNSTLDHFPDRARKLLNRSYGMIPRLLTVPGADVAILDPQFDRRYLTVQPDKSTDGAEVAAEGASFEKHAGCDRNDYEAEQHERGDEGRC